MTNNQLFSEKEIVNSKQILSENWPSSLIEIFSVKTEVIFVFFLGGKQTWAFGRRISQILLHQLKVFLLSFYRCLKRGTLLMKMAAQAPDGNESPPIVLRVTAQQFFRDQMTHYRHAELN